MIIIKGSDIQGGKRIVRSDQKNILVYDGDIHKGGNYLVGTKAESVT